MAKVHRAYKHCWWHPSREITRQDCKDMYIMSEHLHIAQYAIADHFGCSVERVQKAVALRGHEEKKQTAVLRITIADIKKALPKIDAPRDDGSERRAQAPGIPAGVDILQWYAYYTKREDIIKKQQQQTPPTGAEKREFYRDLAIDVYCAARYGRLDAIHKAYSPQGDDLIRYLSDDKRHTLNRGSEEIEDEAQPYQNALE